MSKELVMSTGNLDNIMARLTYCGALLDALIGAMGGQWHGGRPGRCSRSPEQHLPGLSSGYRRCRGGAAMKVKISYLPGEAREADLIRRFVRGLIPIEKDRKSDRHPPFKHIYLTTEKPKKT